MPTREKQPPLALLYAWRHLLKKSFNPNPPPSPPHHAGKSSPLFYLPPELRIQIFEYVLAESSRCPLYIEGHNVRSLQHAPLGHHTALLRTCRAINLEAADTLYEEHELHLLLLRPSLIEDHRRYPVVCTLAELKAHLQSINRLSITVEYGSSFFQQVTSTLLLRWVWHTLHVRHCRPLKSLTLRMTDDALNQAPPNCTAEMAKIAQRFCMLDQPPETVFAAWESRYWCVRGWTQVTALPGGPLLDARLVTETDLRAAVVEASARVPERWWQLRKWFLYI
ncbi:hypothetical protein LTR85_003242 [Meristemomyces frigidus]|nr:hypothetical protein LTR85_003242 [Meristemomyces frigidus]